MSMEMEQYVAQLDDVEARETKHRPEDYGENVRMKLTFMRHEEPGKTPDGMSADYLTEGGRTSARFRGLNLEGGIKKLFASPKKRAKETVDLMGATAMSDVKILNQTFEQMKKEKPEGEKENTFNVREVPELDTVPNLAPLWKEAVDKAKEVTERPAGTREIDLQIQYILDHPERAKELGAPSTEEIAMPLAYRVAYEAGMSGKLLNESDVELIHGTHGPKLEPFLKEVIVDENGKRGFGDVSEIGGAMDPGEGFSIELIRHGKDTEDKPNNFDMTISVRQGTERERKYKVDVPRLLELAHKYEEKLHNKEAAK